MNEIFEMVQAHTTGIVGGISILITTGIAKIVGGVKKEVPAKITETIAPVKEELTQDIADTKEKLLDEVGGVKSLVLDGKKDQLYESFLLAKDRAFSQVNPSRREWYNRAVEKQTQLKEQFGMVVELKQFIEEDNG